MIKDIYFAGGCFWGVEKYFLLINGVVETQVGYANGKTENPTYEQVCREGTGHAEAVWVQYDAARVSLELLLEMLYKVIDPTSRNRQGNDVGEQYRTGIYYTDEADVSVIVQSLAELQKQYKIPLAIEVKALDNYYPAEEYHQKYLDKNPGGYCHISPVAFEQASKAQQWSKKSNEELRTELTPLQYEVTQNAATEPPFKNEYNNTFEPGIYVDITTGQATPSLEPQKED